MKKPALFTVPDFVVMCSTSIYFDIKNSIADGMFIVFAFCVLFLLRYIGQHWEEKSDQMNGDKQKPIECAYPDGKHTLTDPITGDKITYIIKDGKLQSVEIESFHSEYF